MSNEQDELIADVLGTVIQIGESSRAAELGAAVSRHVAARPVAARPVRDPDVAALLSRDERCPLCGRGGET